MASPLPDSLSGAGAASTSSPSKPRLTLDDITRLFSIPITDAASILGVSTSVLKRLCRKNGIARWPYRQLLSGKSIEDIKKEAEIEKNKIQKEREEMGKRKADSKAGSFKNAIAPGQAFQQGNKFMAPHLDPFSPMKNIPTYLDEFKYGFPSSGLSSATNRWWGIEECEPEQSSVKETENRKGPSETLVSLRKRAVDESRTLIEGKKGVENCILNKKEKLTLLQVFGSSVPEQWKNVVS